MSRWRRYGAPRTRPLYAERTGRLGPDGLHELRDAALAELVHAALRGAAPHT